MTDVPVTAPVIAIDGTAACGKGTLARRLASHFGLPHLDTGLLYRAVGLKAAKTGRPPVEIAADLEPSDLADPELRTDVAGQAASKVAAIEEVRANLLEFQRRFAAQATGAVLDYSSPPAPRRGPNGGTGSCATRGSTL